jgi:hypothetical protein
VERLSGVSRLLAVGDVQSNYQPLMALLGAQGIATVHDGVPVWTGGDATLLFLGDLLDGGPQPAEVLWLVMRLHEQAPVAGGRVVLVQGNHELMLLEMAAADDEALAPALGRWFANGGLETLLRLAAAAGMAVPDRLVAQMFTATLGDPEADPEVQELARAVRAEYASELAFVRERARPAVVVNGSLLAVHAGPNLEADGLETLVRDARDEATLAWSRSWLQGWTPGGSEGPFIERLVGLKRRLDDPAQGFALRLLLFAHSQLVPFAVPGLRDKQFRVGRLAGPDLGPGVPAVYCLLTVPRAAPKGGALGGLRIDGDGVTAVYGAEIAAEGRVWPSSERLDGPDRAFLRQPEAPQPLAIACTLTPAELASRRDGLLPGLLIRARERCAVPGGFRWRFEPATGLLAEAVAVVDAERRCCRFLRFQLTVEPDDGPVWLEVSGPEGTQEFLATLLA